MNLFEKHLSKILLVLLVLVLLGQCNNSRRDNSQSKKIAQLESKIDSLTVELKSKPSLKEIDESSVHNFYDFLIYEDDLDKGKTSLSEIKNKASVK